MQDESHTCVRMDSHPQHVQQHPQAHLSPDTQLYPLCGQGPQSLVTGDMYQLQQQHQHQKLQQQQQFNQPTKQQHQQQHQYQQPYPNHQQQPRRQLKQQLPSASSKHPSKRSPLRTPSTKMLRDHGLIFLSSTSTADRSNVALTSSCRSSPFAGSPRTPKNALGDGEQQQHDCRGQHQQESTFLYLEEEENRGSDGSCGGVSMFGRLVDGRAHPLSSAGTQALPADSHMPQSPSLAPTRPRSVPHDGQMRGSLDSCHEYTTYYGQSAVLSTANRKSTEQYQSTNRKSTEQYQSTNRKSTEQYQSTNRKSTERYQSGNSIENMEKLWGNEPKRSCTMADSVASMGLQGTGSANNTNGFVSTTSSSDINVQSIKPIMSEHLPDKSLNPSAYQRGNMLRRSVDSMQYNRKHNGYDGASILHGFLKYHESVGNASTTEQLDEKHSIQASTKPHFDASRPIGRTNQGPTTIKQLEEVHSNLSSPNPLFVATRPIGRPKRGPTTLEQVEEEHSNLSSPNPHYVASRPIGRPNQGPMTIKQQEEVHSNLSCTKPHFVATRPNGRPNRGPTTTEQVEEEHSNLSSSKPHFVGTRLNGRPNRGPMTTEQVEEEHSNQAPFKPQPSWSSSFGGPKRGFASTPLKKGGDTVLLAPYPLAENEMGEMVIESEGPSMRDDIIFKSAFFFFAEVVILLNFIVVLLMVTIFITLSHASQ